MISLKREKYYRGLFLASAIYDVVLGITFIFFYKWAFIFLGIEEKIPEFEGYIPLIGAFLFVIGIAYFLIYRGNLVRNKDLIVVGILYKIAYSVLAFYYFLAGSIPHIIFAALFGVIDIIFFVLMLECFFNLRNQDQSGLPK